MNVPSFQVPCLLNPFAPGLLPYHHFQHRRAADAVAPGQEVNQNQSIFGERDARFFWLIPL